MFLGGSSSGEQKLEKVSHLASLRCRKFRKIKQIGCRSGHDVASLFLMIGTLAQEMNDDKIEVKGGTELKLEGTSGTEVSSSGITKVKGSLIQLN